MKNRQLLILRDGPRGCFGACGCSRKPPTYCCSSELRPLVALDLQVSDTRTTFRPSAHARGSNPSLSASAVGPLKCPPDACQLLLFAAIPRFGDKVCCFAAPI